MPQSSTVRFISYWRGLQRDPLKAPSRAVFDPARLKPMISQMIMLSSSDNGHRFRLSGGFLTALHGKDLKESAFAALFRDPFREPLRAALRAAQNRQQPLVLNITAPWYPKSQFDEVKLELSHSETLSVEICLCPLIGPEGRLDRFVGIYQTYGQPPSTTRGSLGDYSLLSSKIMEPKCNTVAAHLRLVSIEGQLIA